MPLSTIWLKIGNADVRVYKQKVGNALMIPQPDLVMQADDKPVNDLRIAAETQWVRKDKGDKLTVETILKDAEGNEVPLAEGLCIIQHSKTLMLNDNAALVDKKKIHWHILNPDGSVGDRVLPYAPTERIVVRDDAAEVKEPGDAYWIPSTAVDGFLISEEYELPVADPRNDPKLFKEAEDAVKRDEVAITTFSNGGFRAYYAFLCPFFKDGQFEWKLRISDKKVEYNCLHEIPSPTKIPFREVKTLETLPPIQALLTIPAAKKKK